MAADDAPPAPPAPPPPPPPPPPPASAQASTPASAQGPATAPSSSSSSGCSSGYGTWASGTGPESRDGIRKPTDTAPYLELKSPVRPGCSFFYSWPLKKGKGSMRRSEDKQDEAAEIVETIRWVCDEHPEISEAMEGTHYLTDYNILCMETMSKITNTYNKAVDELLAKTHRGTANNRSRSSRSSSSGSSISLSEEFPRAKPAQLKHIIQKCYNKSVIDPNNLNHYEAFTPEVYGETSFELICQILKKVEPIYPANRFMDLGSGVGQVVLQVAALTNCEVSLGIEKAKVPADYAESMEIYFRFWMEFYGKQYSPFKLIRGDFLDSKHKTDILKSSIVFVNNFAFGPEVDQHLKDIFADLTDGARIFSSKSFCALNFRITDRNLSDIGTIMHVSKMDPLKGSVSWTGKPVSYYLHVIDRAKLERYFQKQAAGRKGEKDDDSGRGRQRKSRSTKIHPAAEKGTADGSDAVTVSENMFLDMDMSSSDSRDISRASSVDKEDAPDTPNSTSAAAAAAATVATTTGRRPASKRSGRAAVHKRLSDTLRQLNTDDDDLSAFERRDDRAVAAAGSVKDEDSSRSSVSLDAPHSDAMNTRKKKGRPRKLAAAGGASDRNERISNSIAGLELLHETTMRCINESNADQRAPGGCQNERISEFAPNGIIQHEELPQSLLLDEATGKQIPHQLQLHLEKMKNQYLRIMKDMQEPTFKDRVLADISTEEKNKTELVKRKKQLQQQIDHLITDSLGLLKVRLKELGIQAKTPAEFIEKAKGIVSSHHELHKNKTGYEAEMRQLEVEQAKLVAAKEKEFTEALLKDRPDLSATQIKDLIKKEIELAIHGPPIINSSAADAKVAPLLNKLSDVTFTKCSTGGEQVSTQLRKRPREQSQKQRDWPEKRSKIASSSSSDWPSGSAPSSSSAKIEEKNPEALAKKIIEQGRNLEMKAARSTSAATLTISPSKRDRLESRDREHYPSYRTDHHHHHGHHYTTGGSGQHGPPPPSAPQHHLGAPGVEVRKIEPPSPPYAHGNSSSKTSPTKGHPSQQQHARSSSTVDLPKVDLSVSMASSSNPHSYGQAQAAISSRSGGVPPPLVLPPHPESKSRSSEHTDDLTFAKSKVSTTPRAEQFEDRLKSIIHSVLAGDSTEGGGSGSTSSPAPDMKPPPTAHASTISRGGPSPHLPPHPQGVPPQHPGPMFSPVKRELPSHLPPPPSSTMSHGAPPPSHPPPTSQHQGLPASSRGYHMSPYGPPPPPAGPPVSHHHSSLPPPPSGHHAGAPQLPPGAYPPPMAGSVPRMPPGHMSLPPSSHAGLHPASGLAPQSSRIISPRVSLTHQAPSVHGGRHLDSMPPCSSPATSTALGSSMQHQPPPSAHSGRHMDMMPPCSSPATSTALVGSSRAMNDLISAEIERNLAGVPGSSASSGVAPPPRRGSYPHDPRDYSNLPPGAAPVPAGSPYGHSRPSPGPLHPGSGPRPPTPTSSPGGPGGMARMSQVIEASIRGHVEAASSSSGGRTSSTSSAAAATANDLEGLACPRSKSPEQASRSEKHMARSSSGYGGANSTRPSLHDRDPGREIPHPQRNGGGGGHNAYPAMEGLAARFGSYMKQETPPPPPPSSAHSKNSRPPLQSPPVLPPKKQHLDDHPDYRRDDNKREWQDAISSGFDRLVAYATEVDKRRKSSDSNSPKRNSVSPATPSASSGAPASSRAADAAAGAKDFSESSFLSMKFKRSRHTPSSCSSVSPPLPPPSAAASVSVISRDQVSTPGSTSSRAETPGRSKSPLPGENLPEHHPKKRYFAEASMPPPVSSPSTTTPPPQTSSAASLAGTGSHSHIVDPSKPGGRAAASMR